MPGFRRLLFQGCQELHQVPDLEFVQVLRQIIGHGGFCRPALLNVSLGGVALCSSLEQNAINEILSTTQVRAIVTSSGNESELASMNSPGNCNGVINVAATDRSGKGQ